LGFPGGASAAFDSRGARLAYAWSGPFLDTSAGPGGKSARVLGATFWRAPAGFPVRLTAGDEPPDFAAGGVEVRFEGHSLDKGGGPTFRYSLKAGGAWREVSEWVEGLRHAAGVGVGRRFRLAVPAKHRTWLLAGESRGAPRLLSAAGSALPLDLTKGEAEVPAAGRCLVLPQGGESVAVLAVESAPAGTRWRLRRSRGTWRALLQVPPAPRPGTVAVALNVWGPYRDEPALVKEVLAGRE
jgi:hypothetical protein